MLQIHASASSPIQERREHGDRSPQLRGRSVRPAPLRPAPRWRVAESRHTLDLKTGSQPEIRVDDAIHRQDQQHGLAGSDRGIQSDCCPRAPGRTGPNNSTFPPVARAPGPNNLRVAYIERVFPDADSPTILSASPRRTSNETPGIAERHGGDNTSACSSSGRGLLRGTSSASHKDTRRSVAQKTTGAVLVITPTLSG